MTALASAPVVIPSESAITSRSSHFGELRRAQIADESRDLLLPCMGDAAGVVAGFARKTAAIYAAFGLEFEKVGGSMKNLDSLMAAYLAVWAIFFVYHFTVARRVARLQDEIARLKQTLKQ